MTVSVLDHGAMGDGVTDDTVAIQDVINAAPAEETILFPADRAYLFDSSKGWQIPRAMMLDMRGATLSSTAKQGPKNRGIETLPGVGGCTFLGGRLVGTPYVTGQGFSIGLRIDSAHDVIVDGTEIFDWSTDGIYIGGNEPSTNVKLTGLVMERCRRTSVVLSNADGVSIKDSYFRASAGDPGAGVNSEPNDGEGVKNVEITNCTLDDNRVGLYLHKGHGAPGTNFRVSGCSLNNTALYGVVANDIQGLRVVDCEVSGGVKGMSFGGCTDMMVVSNLVKATEAMTAIGIRDALFFGNDLSGGRIVPISYGFLENVGIIDFNPKGEMHHAFHEGAFDELEVIAVGAIGWKDITEDGQLGKPPKWLLKASGDELVPVKITPRDLGPIQEHYGISVYSRQDGDSVAWRGPTYRAFGSSPLDAVVQLLVLLDDQGVTLI